MTDMTIQQIQRTPTTDLIDMLDQQFVYLNIEESQTIIEELKNRPSIQFLRQTQVKRQCTDCGCTDNDCSQCVESTGHPCTWVASNLCSRCARERGLP